MSPFAGTCGEHGAAEGTLRAPSPTCAAEPPAGLGGAKGRGLLSTRRPPRLGSPSWAPSFCRAGCGLAAQGHHTRVQAQGQVSTDGHTGSTLPRCELAQG